MLSGAILNLAYDKLENFNWSANLIGCAMDESSRGHSMAETDVAALKEALFVQHQLMQKLHVELEEEREASATATSEALSMILRLQGEKAAVKMEANQYRRMTDEKLHHIEETLAVLEELLYCKEMEVASLLFQIEAYKHKMLSIGLRDIDIGETEFLENMPSCRGDPHLDNVGVCVAVGKKVSPPVMGVERGCSYLTKQRIQEDDGHEFKMDKGSPKQKNRVVNNESLSHKYDHNLFEDAVEVCNPYCERIEQLDKQILLSHSKSLEEEFNSEWVLANRELQSTISAYSASPLDVSMSCLRHQSVNSEKLNDSRRRRRIVNELELECCSCLCSTSEAEDHALDFDTLGKETEMSGSTSVHDIYEVPQNHGSGQVCDCQKQESENLILEGEDKLGKPDIVPHDNVDLCLKDKLQWTKKALSFGHPENKLSIMANKVKIDDDRVAMDTKGITTSSQVDVPQLNKRLQLLEDNITIMKQEASEKREEEIKLLKMMHEELKTMQSRLSSPKVEKRSPPDERLIVYAMEAMLSFSI